jgi:hypothetical protein
VGMVSLAIIKLLVDQVDPIDGQLKPIKQFAEVA